jgi:hypothetical protein
MRWRVVASLFAFCLVAAAQSTDCAAITTRGGEATLLADSIRPIDSIANTLAQHYGVIVSAEEPEYLFSGDMESVRLADPDWSASHPQAHYLVPKRRRLEIRFPALPNGSPIDVPELLQRIVQAANVQLPFAYRLDIDGEFSAFIPTRTRNAAGKVIESLPLLDRRITIPSGIRSIAESAIMMADSLSSQTGLHVRCCRSMNGGNAWGRSIEPFEADNEPARKVLERLLRLNSSPPHESWLLRCDSGWCFIEVLSVWGGRCGPMSTSYPNGAGPEQPPTFR